MDERRRRSGESPVPPAGPDAPRLHGDGHGRQDLLRARVQAARARRRGVTDLRGAQGADGTRPARRSSDHQRDGVLGLALVPPGLSRLQRRAAPSYVTKLGKQGRDPCVDDLVICIGEDHGEIFIFDEAEGRWAVRGKVKHSEV